MLHVGDTVLFLFLLCSYWTYSIVSFVSVLRSRDRQSRGSHYCVYIYLDIYTCSFSLLCCCVLSGLFLFVRFRSRVVPLVVAVSSCSINIEHTLTHLSYAQTSTIGDEIFLVFFVSSFFYFFCLYIYIYINILKKKKLLLYPSCFTSTVLFEHFIFNYRYGEEIIFYSFFTCI